MIIVNYRTADLTSACLAALRRDKKSMPGITAILVDGGSGDGSARNLAKLVAHADYREWVSFLALELNGGFGWANNQAILKLAQQTNPPEFIYLLNPDAEITPGAVEVLAKELLDHPACAAAGSQLLSPNEDPVPSAFRFPSPGREFLSAARSEALGKFFGISPIVVKADASVEVDWATGASVMIRSAALRDVGLFDDGFFLYFEEVELMHRMRQRGWGIRFAPESRVIHIEAASTGIAKSQQSGMPAYWYDSRRRYFALTGGSKGVISANLGWAVGRSVGLLKSLLGRRGTPSMTGKQLLRTGLRASVSDLSPSVPHWGDVPGRPPAWLRLK